MAASAGSAGNHSTGPPLSNGRGDMLIEHLNFKSVCLWLASQSPDICAWS